MTSCGSAAWDRFTEWAGRYAGVRTGPLLPGELSGPVLAPSQVFGIGWRGGVRQVAGTVRCGEQR